MVLTAGVKSQKFIERMDGLIKLLSAKDIRVVPGNRACTNGIDTIYLPWLREDASEEEATKFMMYAMHEQAHFYGQSDTTAMSRDKFLHYLQNSLDDIRCEMLQEEEYPGMKEHRREGRRLLFKEFDAPGYRMVSRRNIKMFAKTLAVFMIEKIRFKDLDIDEPLDVFSEYEAAYNRYIADLEPRIRGQRTFKDTLDLAQELHERMKQLIKDEIASRIPEPPKPEPPKPEPPEQPPQEDEPEPDQDGETESGQDGEPESDQGDEPEPDQEDEPEPGQEDEPEPDQDTDSEDPGNNEQEPGDLEEGNESEPESEEPDSDGDGESEQEDGSDGSSDESGDSDSSESGDSDNESGEGDSDDSGSSEGDTDSSEDDGDGQPGQPSGEDPEDGDEPVEPEEPGDEGEDPDYRRAQREREQEIEKRVEEAMDEMSGEDVKDGIEKLAEDINRNASSYDAPYMTDPGVRDILEDFPSGNLSEAERIREAGRKILGSEGSRLTAVFVDQSRPKHIHHQHSGRFDMRSFVSDPMDTRTNIYADKVGAKLDKAAVSILLDCSGSMGNSVFVRALGRDISRMEMSMMVLSALLFYLSRANIPVEATGFTTKKHSYHPELRNDPVVHWRIKTFEEVYGPQILRRCCVSTVGGRMKNNCEIEAVRYAAPRLYARSERKKILLVLGDGKVAFSTVERVNKKGERAYKQYLDLCRKAGIYVFGFGIGCSLGKYFGRDCLTDGGANIGKLMASKLKELLNSPKPRPVP